MKRVTIAPYHNGCCRGRCSGVKFSLYIFKRLESEAVSLILLSVIVGQEVKLTGSFTIRKVGGSECGSVHKWNIWCWFLHWTQKGPYMTTSDINDSEAALALLLSEGTRVCCKQSP